MKTELSIRKHTDYRTFLAAHAQDMKRTHPEWSYGVWARRLGLRDTSSITKILNGDRDPGNQITEQLIAYFQFRDKEALYFRDLVRLSKIRKDPRLSVMLMEKMGKTFPNSDHRLLDEKTFAAISNWFYLPLREMVRMKSFTEESEKLAKRFQFKITPREIKQAIEAMLQLRLLKRNNAGALAVAEGRLSTTDDVASEAIKRYHEKMLENAKLAIRSVDMRDRELQAESIVIKTENMEQAKQMIREFREKFSRTFEEDEGNSVYQIQIQFFPLIKKQEQGDV